MIFQFPVVDWHDRSVKVARFHRTPCPYTSYAPYSSSYIMSVSRIHSTKELWISRIFIRLLFTYRMTLNTTCHIYIWNAPPTQHISLPVSHPDIKRNVFFFASDGMSMWQNMGPYFWSYSTPLVCRSCVISFVCTIFNVSVSQMYTGCKCTLTSCLMFLCQYVTCVCVSVCIFIDIDMSISRPIHQKYPIYAPFNLSMSHIYTLTV